MKAIKITVVSIILLAGISCKKEDPKVAENKEAKTEKPVSNQRIVSISGGVTEIVAALGHEKEIVGIDVTSTYPESLKKTAEELGHVRSMTIEPLLALNPSMILASDKDINPDLLAKIKSSGVQTQLFKQEFTIDGTKKLIDKVAKALGNTNQRIPDYFGKITFKSMAEYDCNGCQKCGSGRQTDRLARGQWVFEHSLQCGARNSQHTSDQNGHYNPRRTYFPNDIFLAQR